MILPLSAPEFLHNFDFLSGFRCCPEELISSPLPLTYWLEKNARSAFAGAC
jgi:hypothetical protein